MDCSAAFRSRLGRPMAGRAQDAAERIGAPRCVASDTPRHSAATVRLQSTTAGQLSVSRAIMDSLANYASDGDNSNDSDDAKVSERARTREEAVRRRRRRRGTSRAQRRTPLDMASLCVLSNATICTALKIFRVAPFFRDPP